MSVNLPKALIFGAGHVGKSILPAVEKRFQIVAFLDNDKAKWEKTFEGFPIHSPEFIFTADYDFIITASLAGFNIIVEQLIGLGVEKEKICTEYVAFHAKSRILFLESLARIFHGENIQGCVAECGVFMGEFAKEINRVFPANKFFLFDTFSGFDARDISVEQKEQFSELGAGHFNITSEEIVMNKLPYPEMCVIKKGYFPETTIGLDEKFCFVNLDFDLYQPTLAGLEFFSPRMVKGGVILIHDYFASGFKGVKAALLDFKMKQKVLSVYPIGDGLSVFIPY